jgi:3-hydroxyisobutyrate dehydrogenase-like beta-hydroxyacid dehydrogenase
MTGVPCLGYVLKHLQVMGTKAVSRSVSIYNIVSVRDCIAKIRQVQLMRKDFGLAVETAGRVGARLALGQEGLKVYTETMNDDKCKNLDSRVVYRYLGGEEEWEEKLKGQQ